MSIPRHDLGHGIGLRPRHFGRLLAERPPVDWMEAVSENYLAPGGRPIAALEKVRRDVPVALHGVSLSIGSTDPLDRSYLASLRALVDRIEPAIVSDHLCWGRHGGRYAHDLWPLPFTEEALEHVIERVGQVQEALGRQILLENVSSYVAFRESTMSEWEFLAEMARRTDCGILLDLNNIYVSARNHGFAAADYIEGMPGDRVAQFHLAGHSDKGAYLFDSHDARVPESVWDLYRMAVARFGPVPSLIEWDDNIPELEVLVGESRKAASIESETLRRRAVGS
ncbi:MAG: DUF692 domain-containing protein [Deltaproteobacteria bacterium]|nr:MAG: DUF692 domain-containing protein [Deltaproteobacteria bacterium]